MHPEKMTIDRHPDNQPWPAQTGDLDLRERKLEFDSEAFGMDDELRSLIRRLGGYLTAFQRLRRRRGTVVAARAKPLASPDGS